MRIEFRVTGANQAEIEREIEAVATRFFNGPSRVVAVRAQPLTETTEGDVLEWEADVNMESR